MVDGRTNTESVGSNVGSEFKKETIPIGENDGSSVIVGIVNSGILITGGSETENLGIVGKGVGADVPDARGDCDGRTAGILYPKKSLRSPLRSPCARANVDTKIANIFTY